MCTLFDPTTPPPPTIVDMRTQNERNLANTRADYFGNLFGKPDLGYQDEEAKLDPIYSRMQDQFKEGVAQSAAEAGFDPLRYGPGVSATARGLQQMGEDRTAGSIQRRQNWMNFAAGQSTPSIGAPGRNVVQQQYGPSPFSQLL